MIELTLRPDIGQEPFLLGGKGSKNKGEKQYIYRHCPNRREGGQPHLKKLKRNDLLTKVGERGGHKTDCRK